MKIGVAFYCAANLTIWLMLLANGHLAAGDTTNIAFIGMWVAASAGVAVIAVFVAAKLEL